VSDRPASPRAAARERIVAAALATLERAGFAGTTARAIAATGGFNQALIYYHFESLDDLFAAALQRFSERRLERYRVALADIRGLTPLVEAMTRLYEEDARSGHLAAAQEIVAGSSSSERLGHRVVELMEPWFAFAEEVVAGLLRGSPLEELVPARELAYALVALYFGVETLARLDGDRGKARALFESGARLAALVDGLVGAGPAAAETELAAGGQADPAARDS
jgi:AcrR family transcriptional regulator